MTGVGPEDTELGATLIRVQNKNPLKMGVGYRERGGERDRERDLVNENKMDCTGSLKFMCLQKAGQRIETRTHEQAEDKVAHDPGPCWGPQSDAQSPKCGQHQAQEGSWKYSHAHSPGHSSESPELHSSSIKSILWGPEKDTIG